ncbi:MAG: prepilin-type N-terminal cleavage/methylation domain-containing protein [Terriglobia bacterium]|jgi:prepilin-type N-terminal cleavage/methylation domain-containing protein
MSRGLLHVPKVGRRDKGFSLLELMVAVAIFILASASSLMLFSRLDTTANQQQGMVGLNIGIRNAAGQLQLDLANAGTGYYVGYNIPSWPVGVTIINNVPAAGTSCYNATTNSYTANCFDQINILAVANSTTYPPINATDSSGANGTSNCSNTSKGVAYGQAATGLTLAATAAKYVSGAQLLFLTSTGQSLTAVVLTQAPTVVGSAVKFTFNATNTDGTNTGANWKTNDPLDITACDGNTCPTPNNFGDQFCGGDWILQLAPITYQVSTANQRDPQLQRVQGGTTTVVMDQILGFKVGVTIWNSVTDSLPTQYNYNAAQYNANNTSPPPYDSAYLFSRVRSVRVSLIARTQPSTDPSFTFRNPFDGGPYVVQGASVVVNPRNLSMND